MPLLIFRIWQCASAATAATTTTVVRCSSPLPSLSRSLSLSTENAAHCRLSSPSWSCRLSHHHLSVLPSLYLSLCTESPSSPYTANTTVDCLYFPTTAIVHLPRLFYPRFIDPPPSLNLQPSAARPRLRSTHLLLVALPNTCRRLDHFRIYNTNPHLSLSNPVLFLSLTFPLSCPVSLSHFQIYNTNPHLSLSNPVMFLSLTFPLRLSRRLPPACYYAAADSLTDAADSFPSSPVYLSSPLLFSITLSHSLPLHYIQHNSSNKRPSHAAALRPAMQQQRPAVGVAAPHLLSSLSCLRVCVSICLSREAI